MVVVNNEIVTDDDMLFRDVYRCNFFASNSVARIGVPSRFLEQQQQKRIGGVGYTNKLFPVLSMKRGKEYGFQVIRYKQNSACI